MSVTNVLTMQTGGKGPCTPRSELIPGAGSLWGLGDLKRKGPSGLAPSDRESSFIGHRRPESRKDVVQASSLNVRLGA